ncbi:MAG: malate dehydrogenase [Deltaproteobacteria bacterium]|nr:malate dehydrogenase [Deltaproteobacteria bacterium]
MISKQNRPKIALLGVGQVGGNLALLAAMRELGDIVLFDIASLEGMAKGKALDIGQLLAVDGLNVNILGTSDWQQIHDADVVIVTAGRPRQKGMSRDDLLDVNVPIIVEVAKNVKQYAPDAFAIIIANPLDAMVHAFSRVANFQKQQVVGMAGVLDSARFRFFIAKKLGVSVSDVTAFVLGGHGDDMVPVVSLCTVGGIPVSQLLKQEEIDAIVERTRKAGSEIVALLKTGSAYYSPAASAICMAEAYLRDQKRVLTCAAYCQGEYNCDGIYFGVPTIIGKGGVEKVLQVELDANAKKALALSASHVVELVKAVDKRIPAINI